MEEEKAAAYYDELTRKGEGAARFKQGLGFSSASNDSAPPPRGSALSSSSSFLSSFVKASSPSKATELPKEAQLSSIQNKLKKKPSESKSQSQSSPRVSIDRDDSYSKRRIRSRSRDRYSRHRSRSRSRDSGRRSRHRSRSRDRDRRSRRSRSRSRSRSRDDYRRRRGDRSRSRSRERDRERGSRRRRSRSESPRMQKSGKKETRNGSNVKVDYGKLIEGYDRMTPAERVKAKMKLQLSETVVKDEANMGSGWERFEFDKDAPLDDEEIEAAEDDVVLVKNIGQSFRFSAVEARKEDALRAAHDEAMFGAPSLPPTENDEEENTEKETSENAPATSLLSDQVMTMQQGSWRDRIRKA